MPNYLLSATQQILIHLPKTAKIFLEGPAGSGKTTVGIERMLHLMSKGIPGNSIQVMVPQRTLGMPYHEAMNTPGVVAGSMVDIVTISGLAQRMVDLFWPVVAGDAGFSSPEKPPTFLNLESAQYYMAYLVRPLLKEGIFNSVTVDRNRLFSQILDNLNKAAVVGFSYQEIGYRLKTAWTGEPGQSRVYDDAQTCANLFRKFCLEHNLLDFSLQIEVFWRHLWNKNICKETLINSYRHLIVDNIEEDVPVTHDLLQEWIPQADSCLVIYDQGAGYRRFLGADPLSAHDLIKKCTNTILLNDSYVCSAQIKSLAAHLKNTISGVVTPRSHVDPRLALVHETHTYFPQMLDWVVAEIEKLINEDAVSPRNIVILAPFLSDSLRFSIVYRLQAKNIPVKTHRPSRSLREEPATMCLLTFASIAHPAWGSVPTRLDIASSLMQSIDGLDWVRAKILTEIVYRIKDGVPSLTPFDQIISSTQERISYVLGEKYEHLRLWLEEYLQTGQTELDYFISRLFGEVLSQPGYGFHANFDYGMVTANLVDSIRKFRRVIGESIQESGMDIGKEYIKMVEDGILAAQYIPSWQTQDEEAVFIAPAYTYLISNYAVDIQFWLDIGNRSWSERLYQPLTHPYVLSRNWSAKKTWTDTEEVDTSEKVLDAIISGLLNRCRRKVYLGLSEYNEQGYEQRGPLLHIFHRMLQLMANS